MKAISIAALLLVSVAAFSQGPPPGMRPPGMQPGMRPPRNFDFNVMEWNVLGKLHLNHMQEVKAKKLTAHYKARFDAMRGQGRPGGNFDAMRDKMRGMRKEYTTELGKILSKDQMASYTKMRDEMRAKMRQMRGGMRGGPGGHMGGPPPGGGR